MNKIDEVCVQTTVGKNWRLAEASASDGRVAFIKQSQESSSQSIS